MPNDEEINAGPIQFNTVGTSWTVNNSNQPIDLNAIDAIYSKAVGKKPKKKKGKEKEHRQLFRCDWCGQDFQATRTEVNPEENGGYYCPDKPKCRIEGKYGRSMLDKELFILEEEDVNDVPDE